MIAFSMPTKTASASGLFLLLLLLMGLATACLTDASPAAATVAADGVAAVAETPYPAPSLALSATSVATAYPGPAQPTATPGRPAATLAVGPPAGGPTVQTFLPLIDSEMRATPTPQPSPTPLPTPTPTIDFTAVRRDLNAQGKELAFAKFGFHLSVGGNRTGLGEWMRRLDAAGVPFFVKSADDAGPLVEAQNLLRASGVPHTLVFRTSGDEYDVPRYDLPPREAARLHWALHMAAFPPELDPSLVWLETLNEVDKERSAWLGDFALATAELALAGGYRWAAFGWSSGEPEETDWTQPSMLAFLRLAAANPDRLAIALHEHSFLADDIAHEYPYKVGRFQTLFAIADRYGFARPTVLITEWGWEYDRTPSPDVALADIRWAAGMYAQYPEVRGAAIWHLGCCFGDVANQTQRLIAPLTEFMLGTYFAAPLPPAQAPIDPDQFLPLP